MHSHAYNAAREHVGYSPTNQTCACTKVLVGLPAQGHPRPSDYAPYLFVNLSCVFCFVRRSNPDGIGVYAAPTNMVTRLILCLQQYRSTRPRAQNAAMKMGVSRLPWYQPYFRVYRLLRLTRYDGILLVVATRRTKNV